MIVKEKLDEEYVSLAEVKEVLNEVSEERADQDREMSYELRRAIDHANELAELEAEEARELIDEVSEFEKVDQLVAHKIADLLPATRDEIRSIFAEERYTLTGDELDEILDVVAKYR
ncbi:MAG: RNA polymerase Rpb4 family protein [Halobacteria archaeon]|nr:RNA polymerase Rpb4 family protein [Halobacteria archaeon]